MSTPWTTLARLLRDRQDPSEVRRIVTRLLGLRLLEAPGIPSWRALVAGGPEAVEQARRTLQRRDPECWPRPLPDLPRERWEAVMEAVGALPVDDADSLGAAFTGLIGELARSEGRRGGQYFTPPSLVALLLRLVRVQGRDVYDPCCGSGGLLVAAGLVGARSLTGQELNPETRRLAAWNARVHRMALDLGPGPADTLRHDLHAGRTFGAILANPPFNLAHWADDATARDPRFALDPPRRQANFAWLLHLLAHLDRDGHAAVILPLGTLHGRDRAEARIRRTLLDEGRVHAILALPDQLFHNTAIGACVWVLGPPTEQVHLFDLRAHGESVDRRTRVLPPALLDRIGAALASGETLDEPGFVRTLPAAALDGDLRPGRWVRREHAVEAPKASEVRAAISRVRALGAEAAAAEEALQAALDALDALDAPHNKGDA